MNAYYIKIDRLDDVQSQDDAVYAAINEQQTEDIKRIINVHPDDYKAFHNKYIKGVSSWYKIPDRWKISEDGYLVAWFECSHCAEQMSNEHGLPTYCPWCGAYMGEE